MINQPNSLGQRVTTWCLVISLLLPSCNKHPNAPVAVTDHIQLASKQALFSNARKEKVNYGETSIQESDQLHATASENITKENLLKSQGLSHAVQGSIKESKDHAKKKVRKKKSKEEIKKSSPADKRKRKKAQENKSQRAEKYTRLEKPAKAKKQTKTKKNKSHKTTIQLPLPDSPGTTNKQIKKKWKSAKDYEILQLGILDLPAELLESIVSCLTWKEAMVARELNHHFYTFITGYDQVGVVGVEKRPDRAITKATWSLKHAIDFNKLTYKLAHMPSFVFYQFMKIVKNLPPIYWSYLAQTQVHTVNFWGNKVGSEELKILGECLQRSKVVKVYLWYNQIQDIGAETFGKTITENSTIREVNLSDNKLQAAGAKGFTEHLPQTMRRINLRNNKIRHIGAIEVAKNVQDKEVEEIDLGENKLEDEGAIGVVKNLQHSVVKRLYLGNNQITDLGIVGIAKIIGETNLEELSLGYNRITNKGAVEIVKHCQGTKMKQLNLSFNRGITDTGALEIANNVEGTILEEIDLRQHKPIGKTTQELLKKQHPHIKWIF